MAQHRLVAICAIFLAACNPAPTSTPSATPTPAPDAAAFLDSHWQRPLPPQGQAPAHFTPVEASLDPAACAGCHQPQHDDWQGSLHAKAMSPGLLGQLLDMAADDTASHQACLECHAPLAEQALTLQHQLAGQGAATEQGASHLQGLTCAGCHVRSHARFGPPRQDGSTPVPGQKLPHDGWRVQPAFHDARFCAPCHQFQPDGPAVNGKLLENTYEEWRLSRHARENRPCQDCHMPGRRHLWRGIHDPDMVRSGLDIQPGPARSEGKRLLASLALTSRHVGHYFPTYVTPLVRVEMTQEDANGRALSGTRQAWPIGRKLALDLSREEYDTRLAPDETRRFDYDRPRHSQARFLRLRLVVEPDAFYADFYRATLTDPEVRKGRPALEAALRAAIASAYVLHEQRLDIDIH
jgi:hypothetical protein